MHRLLIRTALLVYATTLIGTGLAQRPTADTESTTPRADHATAPPLTPARPMRGFAISLHHTDHLPSYIEAIDEIAGLGFNAIEIVTPVFQTDGASEHIFTESGPGRGPTREQIVELLNHARRRGLATVLMPTVLFTHPRGNEWRGKIHPERWQPWWDSYRAIIDRYLDIAVETDTTVFCVGSELLSTERQVDRWTSLIAHARSRFQGPLTYSTNWDHYHVPTLWQHLDMIGISGYWDLTTLTDSDQPDPAQLDERWQQIRRDVLAFARARGRPVLFTEVGYPSLPWGLKDPWNYVNDERQSADPGTQALGYAAFLNAWGTLLKPGGKYSGAHHAAADADLLAGAFFYAWDPYHQGGDHDTGYGVRGKPAYQLLKNWLEMTR